MKPMSTLDEKLEEWVKKVELDYFSKTKKSRELYSKAAKLTPGGVTYSIRYFSPYPPYIVKAKGTRVWDVDGNEYIDYWMGHGAHVLGHLSDVVLGAVKEALDIGTHLGFEHPYVLEYLELLRRVLPGVEMLRFTNSGSEANMYAVRLARAYTKKKYIVKMEGGWHGGVDVLHVGVTYPYRQPESAGLLEDVYKYTLVVPFNDVESLEKTLKSHDVAAVFLEPVMGAAGCIEPEKGYLKEVRRIVDEHDVLLVFDEVITGFRLALGGAQEYYNVKADVVVYGKAIGGGAGAIGAFGAREEIMELLDHIKYRETETRVFHGGTFVANPIVVKAGYALVKHLVENRGIYEASNSLWGFFRKKVESVCLEHGVECWSTGDGSLSSIHFTRKRPRNAREVYEYRWSKLVERAFNLYSRVRGAIYASERLAHFLPSLIHGKGEVEFLINVFADFVESISRLSR